MNEAEIPSGYGMYLLETLLALGAVCLIGYIFLRYGVKRIYGWGRKGTMLRIVEHLPLDPRRSLYLVEVQGQFLLLGASDQGVNLLKEVDIKVGEEVDEEDDEPPMTKSDQIPDSDSSG